jgi:hypothetical protein
VQRFARDQGEAFAVTPHTLRRRLRERGLLATTDADRGKLTVRKTLQGVRRDVLHLAARVPSAPDQTGPTGPEGGAAPGIGPNSGAGFPPPSPFPAQQAAHENGPLLGADGQLGRSGRSDAGEAPDGAGESAGGQTADWEDWQ